MAPPASNRYLVAGSLVLVQVFFGLHYLAAQAVMEEIPPRAWALLRVAGALIVMLAVLKLAGLRFPPREDWGRFAAFALFGIVINQLCFVEGLARTTPTHASLIMTTIPVVTFLMAVALRRERARPVTVAALLVAFLGALLVIRPERGTADGTRILVGDLLTVINATSFSFFLVVAKRTLERTHPIVATTALLLFGTLGMGVAGGVELARLDFASVSSTTWTLGVAIVLLPTVGAYLINSWALARVESSMVAFFIFLQPLIASGLSILFFGERPGIGIAVGAVLILLGSAMTIHGRARRGTSG